jgi:hypothetical protein
MSKQDGITSAFNRRRMLATLGAGGAATLLPSLRGAYAQSNVPTRFVVFYTQHGTLPDPWKPKGPGGTGTPTEMAFELGELHQPLASHKQDLVLLSGLDMRSWAKSQLQACGHVNGQCHSLTNVPQQSKTTASGPSIDQYIVNQWKQKNGGTSPTAVPSLTLGVAGDGYFGQNAFFSGAGQLVPLESSPSKAFQRLFPNGMAPGTGTGDGGASVRRRSQAMDLALGEYAAVGNLLGKAEQAKLSTHADMITDLKSRLAKMPAVTCSAPAAPKASVGFTDGGDAMIKLVQSAFACDLTRVASLWVGSTPDSLCGYSGGMFGSTDTHDLIHKVDGDLRNDAGAVGVVKKFHIAYAAMFNKLLDALAAVPESDGKTMLDHTIVLWAGELAQGGHGCTNLKWVLGGGGATKLKTGRYLNWGDFNRCEYCGDDNVPSNGDLFASIATLIGFPTSTYGTGSKGPIAALTG